MKMRINTHLENVNIFQAGSRFNRGPADQTFLLRSAINHSLYLNKPLYLTLYDFRQCFDKIWLEDSLLSLWKVGVRDEMLKLISIMNERSVAVVKTAGGDTDSFELGPNAKQGTVLGPLLSSASIAECCGEQNKGGAMIGTIPLRILAFVDDLLGLNHRIVDVHSSHNVVTRFSKKKRIPLNEEICLVLPINVSAKEALPILVVNGKELDIVEIAKYLGDFFNAKGDNSDLIEDRVAKGLKCMIISIALAGEITLGVYLIKTQIILYKVMFLTVVLYNSCAWNNLTKLQVSKLRTIQLKFLKRILHAPASTTNCFVYLELGIIPIEYNIHISQLTFLHHILTLDASDPVLLSYHQQKLYPFEKNWFNEVSQLREEYGVAEDDDSIKKLSKDKWKTIVKTHVYSRALADLNHENSLKSKTSHHPERSSLQLQDYFLYLRPSDARLYFSLRCGTFDLKTLRKYSYEDGDVMCRLCEVEEETVEHIVNRCDCISRDDYVENIFSELKEDVEKVVSRVKEFNCLADEMSDDDCS